MTERSGRLDAPLHQHWEGGYSSGVSMLPTMLLEFLLDLFPLTRVCIPFLSCLIFDAGTATSSYFFLCSCFTSILLSDLRCLEFEWSKKVNYCLP